MLQCIAKCNNYCEVKYFSKTVISRVGKVNKTFKLIKAKVNPPKK